jgi:hypothetical protein
MDDMDNEWLSFCEKNYKEPPIVPFMGNYIQIYKDDYTIELLDPCSCKKIPYGTINLVILDGNPLVCDPYNANEFYDNLPPTIKVLKITNLVDVLTNLPISLEKVIIHNYIKEVKEKSKFPFGCVVEYKGSCSITKRQTFKFDSDSDSD